MSTKTTALFEKFSIAILDNFESELRMRLGVGKIPRDKIILFLKEGYKNPDFNELDFYNSLQKVEVAQTVS